MKIEKKSKNFKNKEKEKWRIEIFGLSYVKKT